LITEVAYTCPLKFACFSFRVLWSELIETPSLFLLYVLAATATATAATTETETTETRIYLPFSSKLQDYHATYQHPPGITFNYQATMD